MIDVENLEPVPTAETYVCASCNKTVSVLYQNDFCKTCLLDSFRKLVKVIDSVRH